MFKNKWYLRKYVIMFILLSIFPSISMGMSFDENQESDQQYEVENRSKKASIQQQNRKFLIISQGNLDLYSESLNVIPLRNLFVITEKSSLIDKEKQKFQDIIYVDDYFNSGEIEFVGFNLFQSIPYQTIIATSESDILRAAKLRSVLGIEGQSYESAVIFRDKIKMKTLLSQAGIDVPKFQKALSFLDVVSFVSKYGFPVIVKPIKGYGSVKTCVLRSEEELKNFSKSNTFDEFHEAQFEVEEYIETDEMYHVDGIVRDNTILISWPSRYINQCLDMIRGKPLGSYLLSSDNVLLSRLNEYAAKILSILPIPSDTGFHLELFMRKGDFIFCEVASRIASARINDTWKEGMAIDLKKEFIRAQAFLPSGLLSVPIISPRLVGSLIFPPQKGTVLAIPDTCTIDGVIKYSYNVEVGDELDQSTSMLEHITSFIFTAPTEQELILKAREIEQWNKECIVISIQN